MNFFIPALGVMAGGESWLGRNLISPFLDPRIMG